MNKKTSASVDDSEVATETYVATVSATIAPRATDLAFSLRDLAPKARNVQGERVYALRASSETRDESRSRYHIPTVAPAPNAKVVCLNRTLAPYGARARP